MLRRFDIVVLQNEYCFAAHWLQMHEVRSIVSQPLLSVWKADWRCESLADPILDLFKLPVLLSLLSV
jgi:hypothetical protein